MPEVSATISLEMQLAGSAGAWTDLSSDTYVDPPVRASLGITGTGPMDRIGSIGEMAFMLRNDELNSGTKLGYYSPNHANVRSGFAIGAAARLKMTYAGSVRYKWTGFVQSIAPEAGQYMTRRTEVRCVDWLDIATNSKTSLTEISSNQRADQGISTLIGGMMDLPAASSLAAGQDSFPVIFDTARDEKTAVLAEMSKLVISELGYLYLKGDETTGGVLTFEDRHARIKTGSSTASMNASMAGMTVMRDRAHVKNRIRANVYPRELSAAASILFSLQSKPLVPLSGSIEIEGRYTDPDNRGVTRIGGASMITPASSTDFTMNSASDGTGTDRTANFTVTASLGGNAARYHIVNGAADAYITKLQARGRFYIIREPTTSEKSSACSISDFGENVLDFDMAYQDDPIVADDAANAILSSWKDPVTEVTGLEFIGNTNDALMTQGLLREPGDRITLVEAATGLDKDFFIQGAEIEVGARDILKFRWFLTPSDATNYWVLGIVGRSEMGITTIPGY